MPDYKCTNNDCPTKGVVFQLTSANQTFCPRCLQNTLQQQARVPQVFERMADVTDSAMTTASGDSLKDCQELIGKFSLTRQSEAEARTTSDYIVKLGTDKRKRIDRQGPAKEGNQITHARFAVQLGNPVYAGIWMPIDTNFTIGHVRAAFTRSLTVHKYVRIYKETV